jgi:DNA-binding GntR family transcriptional regulator
MLERGAGREPRVRSHRPMLKALRAGDAAAFREAMSRHLQPTLMELSGSTDAEMKEKTAK